ncbi:MAG: hypothetical protein Q9M40_04195 [Sulfurimonas sp.]|nr:hypothetical protein [Sulfurimonas sp.]
MKKIVLLAMTFAITLVLSASNLKDTISDSDIDVVTPDSVIDLGVVLTEDDFGCGKKSIPYTKCMKKMYDDDSNSDDSNSDDSNSDDSNSDDSNSDDSNSDDSNSDDSNSDDSNSDDSNSDDSNSDDDKMNKAFRYWKGMRPCIMKCVMKHGVHKGTKANMPAQMRACQKECICPSERIGNMHYSPSIMGGK